MTVRPAWDFPRSPTTTRDVVQVGAAHGIPEVTLLAGTGLTVAALEDQALLVEAEQELGVVRNLIWELGDTPGLGLEAGKRFSIGSAGVLGFALLSSLTARDAVSVVVRYSTLSPAYAALTVEEDGDGAVFHYDVSQVPADVVDFLVERDLAALSNVLTMVAGPMLGTTVGRIDLPFGEDRRRLIAELLPSFEIVGAQDRTAIWLPAGVLDFPLPRADPHTAEICAQQCAELIERRRSRRGIAAQVRTLLLRSPGDMPELPDVARELMLSDRTLYRRLEEEGTSFRDLRNEVREALATELLTRAGLTVSEVARRLGYSEPAAFSRAYKSWTGKGPSEVRRT
ncbi:AraC family transcriptional regulator [Nocardioides stalactiti]|uniref:AraC family transcriptional regulator n=1 Tax=Nocardioides stalactiti TaxID=2755356 RepID=UPI0015FFBF0C|nr:AraC family transcriptional regulator [Nocardioides stalactiti]